jgi:hypothetical protein
MRLGPGRSSSGSGLTTHVLRGDDRVNVREFVEVLYRFHAPSRADFRTEVLRGRLVDLSLSGAQIEGPVPETVPREGLLGGSILVQLRMADPLAGRRLDLEAEATWLRPGEGGQASLGLRFVHMEPEQRQAVRAALVSLQSPDRRRRNR